VKRNNIIGFLFILLAGAGCTVEFSPETDDNKDYLVVDGMITDQNMANRIRISRSSRIGEPLTERPVPGAEVTITDEDGIVTLLTEGPPGIYKTDSLTFRGQPGSKYSLKIKLNNKIYETDPVEMLPVPPINSLYYEKVTITDSRDTTELEEGCKIYVDSYDPSGKCLYYRWVYTETWEYKIPYNVVNKVCYVTEHSDEVLIKSTSQYNQARVTKYPVLFVTNKTDRLKETYSILVSQYSLSKNEYDFWVRVRNVSENVGNLYDITPFAIKGNIRCVTDPGETVLGYFSVSAVARKRLFIHERFRGLPHFMTYCATDTLYGVLPETGLNSEYWVIEDFGDEQEPFWVVTTYKECADCTTRGTSIMPSFWYEYLNPK